MFSVECLREGCLVLFCFYHISKGRVAGEGDHFALLSRWWFSILLFIDVCPCLSSSVSSSLAALSSWCQNYDVKLNSKKLKTLFSSLSDVWSCHAFLLDVLASSGSMRISVNFFRRSILAVLEEEGGIRQGQGRERGGWEKEKSWEERKEGLGIGWKREEEGTGRKSVNWQSKERWWCKGRRSGCC